MVDSRASQMLEEDELMDETNQFMKAPNSAQYTNYSLNTTATSRGADLRQKSELKKLEKERREQFERLKKESEALEAEVGALRDKVAAASSRSKVLANENKSLKEQAKVKARRFSKRISSVVLLFYCLLEQFCEV